MRMPVSDPAGKTGGCREIREIGETVVSCERPYRRLVDLRFDEWMANVVVARRLQARPPVAEIVEIGAREELGAGCFSEAAIEIALTEKAAVGGVGEVVFIRKFAGVEHVEPPPLLLGIGLNPLGRQRRHGGRERMDHGDGIPKMAMGEKGERHAVDTAGNGNGGRAATLENRLQPFNLRHLMSHRIALPNAPRIS